MPGYGGAPAEDGAILLDDVRAFAARFVAFPSPAALDAVTLWAAHTHLIEAFESTGRLALLSPEPGSGKTRTLEVLTLLCAAPMPMVNANPAPIFRRLAAGPRTLLVDEVDAIFGGRSTSSDDPRADLRALLNEGHRRGATVDRCVGPKQEVVEFPVFAACALAGLGDLPDTLMSRSVIVRMRRRAPSERVEPFRLRLHGAAGAELAERLAGWADAVRADMAGVWPDMPAGVEDRPADVWEPLLTVADAAGGHWPDTARTACTELVKVAASREASLGVKLLADIRAVLTVAGTDRMPTDDLLGRLCKLDESPWVDLRGKPLDQRGLARRLSGYEVRPHQFKIGETKVRGYSLHGYTPKGASEPEGGLYDAFIRYLPDTCSPEDGTSGTSGPGADSERETGQSGVPDVPPDDLPVPLARYPIHAQVPEVPDVPHPARKVDPVVPHPANSATCATAATAQVSDPESVAHTEPVAHTSATSTASATSDKPLTCGVAEVAHVAPPAGWRCVTCAETLDPVLIRLGAYSHPSAHCDDGYRIAA